MSRQPAAAALPALLTSIHCPALFIGMFQSDSPHRPVTDSKGDLPLPEGPGRDTAKEVCGKCHSTNVWVRQRHSRQEWSSIIDNMVSKGMEASDDDLTVVNDYLAAYLAPEAKQGPSPTPKP